MIAHVASSLERPGRAEAARSESVRRPLAVALTLAVVIAPSTAAANGAFPQAGQILVDPSDPTHIIARTTFGLLTTRDAGLRWDWICEHGIGYQDYLPAMAVTGDGSVLAGLTDGLRVAAPGTCSFTYGAGLEPYFAVDVTVDRTNPAIAWVNAAAPQESDTLWRSTDQGVSWTLQGAPLPLDFTSLTVDVAPSDPSRLYVSGLSGTDYTGAIARSTDLGVSWTIHAIPGSDAQSAPYLGAIDPTNADIVYARLDGAPGRLVATQDGGDTWQTIFMGVGSLRGFALSPDGGEIAVGGATDGMWRGDAENFEFEKMSYTSLQCLTWTEAGIYACATEPFDEFTLGLSQDGGASFATLLELPCLRGPLDCPVESSVGSICPSEWPAIALQTNHVDECPTSVGAGGQGGAGGSGGGPPDAGPPPDGGGGQGGARSAPPTPPAETCACRLSDQGKDAPPFSAFLLVLFTALRRVIKYRRHSTP
jgi:hypothetical protein